MKIEKIETFLLKAELQSDSQFYSSQAPFGDRNSLLVKMTTDEGIIGWGESGVSMPLEHVQSYIHDVIAPGIIGRNALASEPLWHELYASSRDFGRKATPIDALSGIDIALWDIRGKEAGKPVYALMGGAYRDRVRAYATGLYYTEDDVRDPKGAASRVREEVQRYREAGFSAVKGKVGMLPVQTDILRMQAARDAAGGEFLLMTDANHAYNRHTALRMGRALEELNFHWFEEPLVPEDISGSVALRSQLDIAIAGGECEYTRYGMNDLLRVGAVDILQPDLSACGGLSEGQKILALASAFHTPVCLHVWGSGVAVAAALQLTAVIPPQPHTVSPVASENDPIFEFDRTCNPLRDELIAGGFVLQDEVLQIPDGPGLGCDVDESVLERFLVNRRSSEQERS